MDTLKHIQAYSGMFSNMCNPPIFIPSALGYLELILNFAKRWPGIFGTLPWDIPAIFRHIQNLVQPLHIQILHIFDTVLNTLN